MNDVIVRLVPLPKGANACVLEDPAGDYNVYISEQLDSQKQRKAYEHEMQHIKKGHLHDQRTARENESEIRDELQVALELGSKSCSVVHADGFNMLILSRRTNDV